LVATVKKSLSDMGEDHQYDQVAARCALRLSQKGDSPAAMEIANLVRDEAKRQEVLERMSRK
jgi:hypothetical protein